MIRLHQFAPAFGLPNPSPYCVKLEAWLRLTGLDYEVVVIDNPSKGPKGKAPFVVDGDETIADSSFVIERLKAKYGVDPDANLSLPERAVARAIAKMLEEHFNWCFVHSRWIDEQGWPILRAEFETKMPKLLIKLLLPMFRRKVRANLAAQGMGRHSQEEIYHLGCGDIDAISGQLADRPWLLGAYPTTVDCTAIAYLGGLMRGPFHNAMRRHAEGLDNVRAYERRGMERFFPEYLGPEREAA